MNIGNPTEFTIKQLAEMTVRLTKSNSKIIYKPLPQVMRCFSVFVICFLRNCEIVAVPAGRDDPTLKSCSCCLEEQN